MPTLLITHGYRFPGANPGHTKEGFDQIRRLAPMIPYDVPLFIIGTGKRFREIHETIVEARPDLISVRKKHSPFCGSVDGLDKDEDGNNVVILADGTPVNLEKDYISLNASCFDAWEFINLLPPHKLLCAGGELMIALGLRDINEKGQLYYIEPTIEDGWKIS